MFKYRQSSHILSSTVMFLERIGGPVLLLQYKHHWLVSGDGEDATDANGRRQMVRTWLVTLSDLPTPCVVLYHTEFQDQDCRPLAKRNRGHVECPYQNTRDSSSVEPSIIFLDISITLGNLTVKWFWVKNQWVLQCCVCLSTNSLYVMSSEEIVSFGTGHIACHLVLDQLSSNSIWNHKDTWLTVRLLHSIWPILLLRRLDWCPL